MEKCKVKPVSSSNKNSLDVEPEQAASFPLHSNWCCPLYGEQWHANAGVSAAKQAVLSLRNNAALRGFLFKSYALSKNETSVNTKNSFCDEI